MDQNGHINHGWRLPARRKIESATRIEGPNGEYREGELLRKCKFCSKFIPFGISFHYEECAGQP
jgi:hypothetical protein